MLATNSEIIKIQSLNDNPGLLPIKLGTSHNKIDSWTFMQSFNINKIIDEFLVLQQSYIKVKNAIENSTHHKDYKKEYYNSYRITEILQSKIITQINQINPLNKLNKRTKRGIIDGLGSAIKIVTGNLDHNDAIKYDHALTKLSESQNENKVLIKEQITLLQNSIKKFNDSINTIVHNQEILKTRIVQIEYIIQTTQLKNIETQWELLLQMIFSQLTSSFQILYDILERLEVAITFSKLNVFHNSIVDPNEFLHEIATVNKYLTIGKLPFEPIHKNILLLERLIEVKSYLKENNIIFILNLPIVETKIYNYYELYSLPVFILNSFKTIIPKSRYLLSNEQSYSLSNTKCKEIVPEKFICEELRTYEKSEHNPCEVNLITYTKNQSNCKQIPVKISEIKIQKLKNNQWIVVAPKSVVASAKCGKTSENVFLNGTNAITVKKSCEVKIGDVSVNSRKISELNFNDENVPNIFVRSFFDFNDKKTNNVKPIELDNVDLDELKTVYKSLNLQGKILNNEKENWIYFHKISIYSIIQYFIIIIVALCFIYYRFRQKFNSSTSETKITEEVTIPNIQFRT